VEGIYLIETFYSDAFNRATNAPFTVNHMTGQSVVTINQTQTGNWRTIGSFQFRGNNPANDWVFLSNHQVSLSQYIAADAIRATLLEQTPVTLAEFVVE
jgi:hypothetical protein